MPVAEIIAIGTELLLGEIQDTNTSYLARLLRDDGIDLYRTMIVGDNPARIAQSIHESLQRSQIIITTGGLGPTVDDPTRQAVANAVGVDLEYRPELWDQIQDRFRRYGRVPSENNKRQAYIPKGAKIIENPVGTAPAFIYETESQALISLPGVPREMEFLMEQAILPYLRQRYQLVGTIKALVLHTASVGESTIDELIGDLEAQSNPTVGLAAHPGQIDIRITAKAASVEEADRMIQEKVDLISKRLGSMIYGTDHETLEEVTLNLLSLKGWKFVVIESGMDGKLLQKLAHAEYPFMGGEIMPDGSTLQSIKDHLSLFMGEQNAQVGLGSILTPNGSKQDLRMILVTPDGIKDAAYSHGGPYQNAPSWAVNNSLNFIRTNFLNS